MGRSLVPAESVAWVASAQPEQPDVIRISFRGRKLAVELVGAAVGRGIEHDGSFRVVKTRPEGAGDRRKSAR